MKSAQRRYQDAFAYYARAYFDCQSAPSPHNTTVLLAAKAEYDEAQREYKLAINAFRNGRVA